MSVGGSRSSDALPADQPLRILIVEDDRAFGDVLQDTLGRLGYEAIHAPDGIAAWELLQRADAPDLVLLDWMMPGMSGLQLCRRIREAETDSSPYIILLTARDRKEDIVAGLRVGANDYVKKPFDLDELQARIEAGRRVLELQRALAERVKDLEDALAHVKRLQGLLPICVYCHKIRDDHEIWQDVEAYVGEQTGAQLGPGMCPTCLQEHFPDSDEG